ncbi:adenosine 3'-phospho 5'-phosphosulfate transporter 2-like [Pecten maximus]|uniref:adenosine 3'-phospho 5'-phosphosulfate transporter 2-like n=1 Tax=Pecten maximus TaxID=6579 RepID=UPI001458C66D|nr:adenosine 3'-phospho 5'-phosphosulfate transporter 2-like [Pecten maximus]
MATNSLDRVMRGSKLKLLFLDISHLTSNVQMTVLSTAVCGFFITGGIFQELVSRIYRKELLIYNWYMTLIQLGCFSLFGLMKLQLKMTTIRRYHSFDD